MDWSDLLGGLYALNQSLKDVGGYCASRDYLEQGMAAYQAALQGQPGQALPPMLHS